MSQTTPSKHAAVALERDIAGLAPLFDALEGALIDEAGALTDSAGGAALLDAVGRKQQALRDLERALARRDIAAVLRDMSTADFEGLTREPFWQAFTARLHRCRGMNLAAGGAIATAQRQTQVGLELLGQAPVTNAYDQSGRTGADRTGRNLARC